MGCRSLKKIKLFKISLLMLLTVIGLSAGSLTVNAASWHHGTPKEIRGLYQGKRTSQAEGFGYYYTVTSKSFTLAVSNWPLQKDVHLKYKKPRPHVYRLVGHTQKRGIVKGGHSDSVVYRKGKLLLTTDYKTYQKKKLKAFKLDLKNPAKRTHKLSGEEGPIVRS